MADRYQERPFPADGDYNRGTDRAKPRTEGDPLAELARLIGQTDPFAGYGRDGQPPRRQDPVQQEDPANYEAEVPPPGPPTWMQRVAAHDAQQQELENLKSQPRYAAPYPEPEPEYHQEPSFAASGYPREQAADPGRYDDALYGHADSREPQLDAPYQDDPYAFPDSYDEPEEAPKRRGGMVTVAVVLALAVVGTGAAFAYRTFIGSPRSGEPPVIRADAGPNKVVPPSSADASGKLIQDRLGGPAPEKLVSREEQPVDVQDNTKAGPRVVFPPLNQNAMPPSAASVAPSARPMVGNGAVQGDEPRRIRTFSVKGDQADGASATPASRQAPARITAPAAPAPARSATPANANASANAPMSLSPQAAPAAPAPARVANNAPQQVAPAAAGGGGYLVQLSSQRSEGEAQASFRSLQGKFPAVLGSRSPVIRRADLGEKGTYYRAMVGPFASAEEATQFCGTLKTAGGQCVVPRN
jgi:hypothetical protein